jgi:NhaP-type Na+/H+ or K+/H+ antiporter
MAVGGNWFLGWVVDDVVVKLSIGLVVGLVLGRLIAWLTFGRNLAHASPARVRAWWRSGSPSRSTG